MGPFFVEKEPIPKNPTVGGSPSPSMTTLSFLSIYADVEGVKLFSTAHTETGRLDSMQSMNI
jgi:hypothetical protein